MDREHDWRSYDAVAENYDRVAVPAFAPLAGDLVTKMVLVPGEVVLDVGTGTGLTAELARDAVGPRGLVVGVDPSRGMLQIARSRRRINTVCAEAPGLPFGDARFDAVVANLVLSHLPDVATGLADMTRVLRLGGRLGVTAWAPDDESADNDAPRAAEIVAPLRAIYGIPESSPVKGVPWEELLKSRTSLEKALIDTGLVHVDIELVRHRHPISVEDHAAGWAALSRYRRSVVGEDQWRNFCERAAATLRENFGDELFITGRAWVATGIVTA